MEVTDDDGGLIKTASKMETHEAIWDEVHWKRFYMAEEAPICRGGIRGDFGYMATSPTAQAVLDGTY